VQKCIAYYNSFNGENFTPSHIVYKQNAEDPLKKSHRRIKEIIIEILRNHHVDVRHMLLSNLVIWILYRVAFKYAKFEGQRAVLGLA
jgi:hypothetical protein